MTERYSTTAATGISPAWSPAGDVVLQADCADPHALVDIEGRVNDAAPWRLIFTFGASSAPFAQIPRLPSLRAVVRENVAGSAVRVFEALL